MDVNPQKHRKGFNRLWHALGYSLSGLAMAWHEAAFRLEVVLAIVLIPLSFWVGQTWLEIALLSGSLIGVLVVELLNTGIESTVDRVGTEWHALAKRAKDMGSAAVLLSLLWCAGVWGLALWTRFLP